MRGPGASSPIIQAGWTFSFRNAAMPVFFVLEAEVASWPGINILTRVTDTHFVARDPRLARAGRGIRRRCPRPATGCCFSPRAPAPTASASALPPTLFQGFLDPALPEDLAIQPMSAHYHAPLRAAIRALRWLVGRHGPGPASAGGAGAISAEQSPCACMTRCRWRARRARRSAATEAAIRRASRPTDRAFTAARTSGWSGRRRCR